MLDQHPIYIDLMRHGEPVGGKRYRGITDDPLSQLGWQQMLAAANFSQAWQKIITSPLLRCRNFSTQLARQRNIPVFEDEALREMHFGEWEGLTPEQLWHQDRERYNAFLQNPLLTTPPAGESLSQFSQRIIHAWQKIIDKLNDNHTLLVIHGGSIRVILHEVLGIPLSSIMKIEVPYACTTRLEVIHDKANSPYIRLISHAVPELTIHEDASGHG